MLFVILVLLFHGTIADDGVLAARGLVWRWKAPLVDSLASVWFFHCGPPFSMGALSLRALKKDFAGMAVVLIAIALDAGSLTSIIATTLVAEGGVTVVGDFDLIWFDRPLQFE